MNGWEPTETQAHEYDDDGRLVRTIVTRESEWSDHERDKMQALVEYEAGICQCGMHREIADQDPDLELVPRTCPVCAGTARLMREIHAADEAAEKAMGEHIAPGSARPDDGRSFAIRQKAPQ